MINIIDIFHNHDEIISKVNYIAGYFNKEKFKEINFQMKDPLKRR